MSEPQMEAQYEWRRKIDEGVASVNGMQVWLLSFTDLFSILLCFFILMYAMKDPDMDSISQIIGGRGGGGYAGHGLQQAGGDLMGANVKRASYARGLDLSYLNSVITGSIEGAGLKDRVSITAYPTYLALQVDSEANVKDTAQRLGRALMGLSNSIKVVGVPAGWRVGDWGAAVESAGQFAGYMKEGGYHKPLAITGLGQNAQASGGAMVELYIEGYSE